MGYLHYQIVMTAALNIHFMAEPIFKLHKQTTEIHSL